MSRLHSTTGSRPQASRKAWLVLATAVVSVGMIAQTGTPAAAAAPKSASPQTTTVQSSSVYTSLAAPTRLVNGVAISPGNPLNVTVAGGSTGVPIGAQSVVVNLASANNVDAGYLQAFPAGGSTTSAALNQYYANQLQSELATVPVGNGGQITISTHVATTLFVDEQGYYAAAGSGTAGQYQALPPARLTDTRSGGTPLTSGGTLRIQVTGAGGVPATGAAAAVVNIAALDDPNAGFLQAYATTRPTSPQTANVNYNGSSIHSASLPCPSGTSTSSGCDITSNRAIVALDATGGFTIYANAGPVDLVVDVNGYFTDATASTGQFFTPTGVSRLYDSRIGGNTMAARATLNLPIAGAGGSNPVIPSGATAAVLSVAIDKTIPNNSSHPFDTGPGPGFLTVFPGPTGSTRPLAADANFAANSIVSSHVYATLGADGSINIYNGSDSPIDVIVDAYGFFSSFATAPTPFTVAVSANPSSVPADGTTTSAITATVTDANGAAVSGDTVNWTVTGTGCGTASPASSTTTSGGTATTTYTASTTAGTCTVTATEQTNGQSGSTTVTQTHLTPFTVTATANPSTIPADGTSTSTITATVKDKSGAAVSGDTVTFTTSGGTSCGTLSPTTFTTNASGQATTTYTASKTPGTCTITATEAINSQSGTTKVTQTGLTITANPSSIPADTTTKSTITVTVTNAGGPVNGDLVSLNAVGNPAGTCSNANLSATSGTTNPQGQFTAMLTASNVPGTCTITATEANNGLTGSTVVQETQTKNTVAFTNAQCKVPANGTTTCAITGTVTNTAAGAGVVGDTVNFTLVGNPAAACGSVSPTTTTTTAGGAFSTTYTASNTPGFCTITATETQTGGSGSQVEDQTSSPAAANTVTETVTCPVGGTAANPSTTLGNGTSTCSVKAVVTTTAAPNSPVSGDPVYFSVTGAGCGTVSPAVVTTDSTGTATTTYTASTKAPASCTVTAQEAQGGSSNGTAQVINQTGSSTMTATASPQNVAAGSTQTSTITVTVTDQNGQPLSADQLTYAAAGTCGTITPPSGSVAAKTGTNGQATFTYTAAATVGFCTITFTEATNGKTASVTIDNTANPAPAPFTNTVTASCGAAPGTGSTVPANGTTCAITDTVTASGTAVSGDTVMFTVSGANCGTVAPTSSNTNSNGQATTVYTSSTTAGTCTITAKDAQSGGSGSVVITQTAVTNGITVTANSCNAPPTSPQVTAPPAAATPANQCSITFTVTNAANPTGLSGDTINVTTTNPNPAGACGTVSPTTGTTSGTGTFTVTYTASGTPGFCTVVGTETGTNQSASAPVTQTTAPPQSTNTVTVTSTSTPNCSALVANGTSQCTVQALVKNAASAPVPNDPVRFTLSSAAAPCGTISPAYGVTNASGIVTATYTAPSGTTGTTTCTITATEAFGDQSGTLATSQTQQPNTIRLTGPSTVARNQSAVYTATVTSPAGTPVNGDTVNFSVTCSGGTGTITPASGTTNANGQATTTFTAPNASSICTLTATETATSATTTEQITTS